MNKKKLFKEKRWKTQRKLHAHINKKYSKSTCAASSIKITDQATPINEEKRIKMK